jgi:hypothetical protein
MQQPEMEHPEKILGISFVSNDQPAKVLQPGKQPFNFPPTAIPSQASVVGQFDKALILKALA